MRPRLLLAFICLALTYAYFWFVVPDCLHDRASCFGDFTQLAPFKYRVLQPTLERLIDPHPSQEALLWIDVGLQAALSTVSVVALYVWLRRQFDEPQSLLGVALFAVCYALSFHFYQRALHTSLEVASVTVALAIIGKPTPTS